MDRMHVLLLALLALALAGCGVLGALLRRALRRAALLRDALSEAGEGNLCRLISATGTARERKALRALNEGLVQRNARRQRARRASAPVRPERCDLCALTREALDACRPLLEGSGLVLDARLPEEPVFATADPAALTRALSLLLQAVALHPGARGRALHGHAGRIGGGNGRRAPGCRGGASRPCRGPGQRPGACAAAQKKKRALQAPKAREARANAAWGPLEGAPCGVFWGAAPSPGRGMPPCTRARAPMRQGRVMALPLHPGVLCPCRYSVCDASGSSRPRNVHSCSRFLSMFATSTEPPRSSP